MWLPHAGAEWSRISCCVSLCVDNEQEVHAFSLVHTQCSLETDDFTFTADAQKRQSERF